MRDTEIDLGVAYYKNENTVVKVTASYFDKMSQWYVHIREYGYDGDTNTWFRTPKGYAIKAEELDSVIDLLQKASKELTDKFYEEHNKE